MSEAFVPCELKGKQNLGSMDEYADLFVTLASCIVLWQNKLQIRIRSARFIMREREKFGK